MSDNVTLPGSGAVVAADEVDGVQYQRIKTTFGADGSATDVSSVNPLPVRSDVGTLVERIELLVALVSRMLSTASGGVPDTLGRTRVLVDAITSSLTLNQVTTVSAVTKLSQVGSVGWDASMLLVSQSNASALALRDRITVT